MAKKQRPNCPKEHDTHTKSFYDFETLHDAQVFFNRKGIAAHTVRVGGAFGLDTPTEDDTPVFMWEA
jgi:hypothetical protein